MSVVTLDKFLKLFSVASDPLLLTGLYEKLGRLHRVWSAEEDFSFPGQENAHSWWLGPSYHGCGIFSTPAFCLSAAGGAG